MCTIQDIDVIRKSNRHITLLAIPGRRKIQLIMPRYLLFILNNGHPLSLQEITDVFKTYPEVIKQEIA